MTQAVEKISDIERKVKGKIIIAPLENEIKQKFKQVSRNARIQGFRPGKAPMSIIEKQYGPDIRSEVYSRAIETQFGQIVQENKLNIVGMPQITHDPLPEIKDDFEFTATFEVLPEVKDIDFKKIEITRPEVKLSKKDIETTIETMQRCKNNEPHSKKLNVHQNLETGFMSSLNLTLMEKQLNQLVLNH